MRHVRCAVLMVCAALTVVSRGDADTLRVQTANRALSAGTPTPITPSAAAVIPAGAPGDSPRNLNHAVWTHTKGESTAQSRPPVHLLGGSRPASTNQPSGSNVPVQPVGGFTHYPFGYYGAHGRYPAGATYYSYGPAARPYPSVPRQYSAAIRSNPVVPEDPNGLGDRAAEFSGSPHPLAGPYGVTVGGSPVGYPGYGPHHVLPFGYGWNGYGWGGYSPYLGMPHGFPAYGAAGYARWNYGPAFNPTPIGVPYYYQYAW